MTAGVAHPPGQMSPKELGAQEGQSAEPIVHVVWINLDVEALQISREGM